jgi:large subunit ribosomal protein L7A
LLEDLKKTNQRIIGTKQTIKAVEDGCVKVVFLANDADEFIRNKIKTACERAQVSIHNVESMSVLGEACEIEVGAATAALLSNIS